MAYIGNDPSNRFVAPKAASVFSGDGSTTAFTLDHAVGSDEDILVSVDGVIQEPSVAYAVSSGTTLTFTAAPSSNSGNNIFVYYLFRTVGTVSHPSNNALTATTGTFTGAFTSLGIDDNADATAITIDSDENVSLGGKLGIGATTIDSDIHLEKSSDLQIKLERTGSGTSTISVPSSGQLELNNTSNAAMTFSTNNTERMRIDSSGNVMIGTTTVDLSAISSGTGTTVTSTGQLLLAHDGNNMGFMNLTDYDSGTENFFVFLSDASTKGSIGFNGSNTVYATSSDYRLKENINYSFDASSQVKKLKPCEFNFKTNSDVKVTGFIAHEAQEVCPLAVTGVKDETEKYTDENGDEKTRDVIQGIDTSLLVPLLTKSLQEALAEIDTLKTKVAALESK